LTVRGDELLAIEAALRYTADTLWDDEELEAEPIMRRDHQLTERTLERIRAKRIAELGSELDP